MHHITLPNHIFHGFIHSNKKMRQRDWKQEVSQLEMSKQRKSECSKMKPEQITGVRQKVGTIRAVHYPGSGGPFVRHSADGEGTEQDREAG